MVCVDDKFSKTFKSYLGEDAVCHFINSVVEESKYCNDVIIKHFSELVMNKKDNKDFEKFIKCWIWDNVFVDNYVKVRDHCHITRKYRSSARRDCNINFKLSHKIPMIFHNLKNNDSHYIM